MAGNSDGVAGSMDYTALKYATDGTLNLVAAEFKAALPFVSTASDFNDSIHN